MCDVYQLVKQVIPVSGKGNKTTHELCTVHVSVLLDKLIDITVVHPFRYHFKPLLHLNAKQRQNIWVLEVLPSNSFPTESLWVVKLGSDLPTNLCEWAHTAVPIEIAEVDSHDLDGHSASMVNSSKHICVATTLDWVGFFAVTVCDVH